MHGAAVLHDADAARGNLLVHAMVERDHRVGDVFLETLAREHPFATFGRDQLQAVAAELNARPRKRLSWQTPAEALADVLSDPLLR